MIGPGGITRLAEMICGDAPFDFFPYRSSSSLTRFFVDLDMEYVHDGSTRRTSSMFWYVTVVKCYSRQLSGNVFAMSFRNRPITEIEN